MRRQRPLVRRGGGRRAGGEQGRPRQVLAAEGAANQGRWPARPADVPNHRPGSTSGRRTRAPGQAQEGRSRREGGDAQWRVEQEDTQRVGRRVRHEARAGKGHLDACGCGRVPVLFCRRCSLVPVAWPVAASTSCWRTGLTSTAPTGASKALPLPCVSNAFVAAILLLPGVSTAFRG